MKTSYHSHNKTLTYLHNVDNQLPVAQIIMKHNVKSVLDIGCFDGTLLGALNKLNASVNYKGVDISEDMVRQAKEKYPQHTFEVGDARSYLENDYEMVVFGGVFYYFDEAEALNVVSRFVRKTNTKYILFHDVKRCRNKIYKNPLSNYIVERGEFKMQYGKHTLSKADNSLRKYIIIYG